MLVFLKKGIWKARNAWGLPQIPEKVRVNHILILSLQRKLGKMISSYLRRFSQDKRAGLWSRFSVNCKLLAVIRGAMIKKWTCHAHFTQVLSCLEPSGFPLWFSWHRPEGNLANFTQYICTPHMCSAGEESLGTGVKYRPCGCRELNLDPLE